MARFRLRFLLQEFDLIGPEVVIGRSPECHVTIEDPLVSRRHARIEIDGDEAIVYDLGSRNGVRVNGQFIDRSARVRDGDRIRLGTQELVLSVVKQPERSARITGFMTVCGSCRTPFPEQARQCPHCGAPPSPQVHDDTLSGLSVEPRRSWTFQLLGQVIERALGADKAEEADRILGRATREVEERLAAGDVLAPDQIATIAVFALRLATMQRSAQWVRWALDIHRQLGQLPSAEVVQQLEGLAALGDPDLSAAVAEFAHWSVGEGGGGEGGSEALDRLRSLGVD